MSDRSGGISRLEASKKVMRAISRMSPDRVERFFHAEDGSLPVIVALPHEHASDIIARVQSIGGGGNVAVVFAKNFAIVPLQPHGDADAEIVISQDLSMGMLLLKMKQNPGQVIRLKLRDRDAEFPLSDAELAYA